MSETETSEFGDGSGTFICVVGVLTEKTEPDVGVAGFEAVVIKDREGVAAVAVGVTAPSACGMAVVSLSSRHACGFA